MNYRQQGEWIGVLLRLAVAASSKLKAHNGGVGRSRDEGQERAPEGYEFNKRKWLILAVFKPF